MQLHADTVVAVLLLAAAAPATGSAPHLTSASSSADVTKAIESDTFRMVFLAGLEGAGHHYIMASDSAMLDMYPNLPRINETYLLSPKPYYLPTFMATSTTNYAQQEHKAREAMKRLAEQAAALPPPGSVYILHNSWSYPTFHGTHKVTQYIDLQRIAEVAEDTGVDLRVLYLRRSAKGLLVANTVHRHFQNKLDKAALGTSPEELFLEYVRILFTNIAVLQSFLSELQPGLIVCHDWELLGDKGQASEIASFISPNQEVAELVESALVGTVSGKRARRGADSLPFEGADALASRLQRKLDAFEARYCAP